MIRITIIFILFHLVHLEANAQVSDPSLVSAAGDSFQNDMLQLDWSLGEIMTETFTSANAILTQGLHQSDIEVIASIENNMISISIYPNPATEFINFQMEYHKYPNLTTIIYDGTGRIMLESRINGSEDTLDISELKEGTYHINIYGNGSILSTSKLIKN